MEKQSFKGVPESNWVVGPCRTEEIAKQVLAVAHAYGYKWRTDYSFAELTPYKTYGKQTCYWLSCGGFAPMEFYLEEGHTIISPETFLANNPMPEEKPEEKTRKPGVKYTLEDWKKEADACRKRAEYWKDKHSDTLKKAMELQTENKILKDSIAELKYERDFLDSDRNDVRHTLEKLQLDLDHTNKNYLILQAENKGLKESNDQLRKWNNEQVKTIESAQKEAREMYKRNLDLDEELKTAKSHLELRTKGIQALEEDAKRLTKANYELTERVRNSESQNRKDIVEIGLLKDTIENKTSELQYACNAHNEISDRYNKLRNDKRHTTILGWAGWIFFFIALFGLMFYKG